MGILGYQTGNALAARKSRFARAARAFIAQPEPRSIGVPARGKQMLSGYFLFAGHVVEDPDKSLWKIASPDLFFEQELHGFSWLDHLVAEGSSDAQRISKDWVWEWIDRFGAGNGIGWTPQLTGRRVIRLINHSILLLGKEDSERQKLYFKTLGQQATFLWKRWKAAPPGLPRFEALTGLIYCGLALEGKEQYLEPSMKNIAKECAVFIDEDGGIESRNPEELMNIFTSLAWASYIVTDAGKTPERDHLLAMERMVPTLRALRLGDGGLGHFHGGGRGIEGRLDQALSDSAVRIPAKEDGGMGYVRMSRGNTLLLVDGGKQPIKPRGSFSALAFEMSIGREPLIVNMGPGLIFGVDWWDTSRAVMAHSGVSVLETSPSVDPIKRRKQTPIEPVLERASHLEFEMLAGSHAGFVPLLGLRHFRSLELSQDGLLLRGKDRLVADTEKEKSKFKTWITQNSKRAIPWEIRFHISPDVSVETGLNDTVAVLTTQKGEVWALRSPDAKLVLKKSAYMQYGRLNPRATKQVVVSGKAIDYEGVIEWSLAQLES